jgi:hypothetical protein
MFCFDMILGTLILSAKTRMKRSSLAQRDLNSVLEVHRICKYPQFKSRLLSKLFVDFPQNDKL